MVATPWGESDSLRERMLRPGPGTSPEEVAENQRDRLFGAMVACVARAGYEATRVADLVEVSGVSSRSFYDLFPNKEACFVAAFEAILERETLKSYDSFVAMIAAQPAAASLCLVEAYAAGPAAQAALDVALAGFAELSAERAAAMPEMAAVPAEMVQAHIGALQEIARTRLRRGRPEEMAALVGDLEQVVGAYRPPTAPLRLATRPPSFGPEGVAAHEDAERVLRAFAVVVAERGYHGVTIHEVAKRGSMSPATFYANFRDKEDALLAAIDSVCAQLVTAAMTAFHRSPDWGAGVRAAIGGTLNFLASRPAMAHLLGVAIYAGGAKALGRRAQALSPLAALLTEGYRLAPEVPALAAEAIGGGIAALVLQRLREEGPSSLPSLAPICTYIVLAPFLGAERATAAANGDGRVRVADAFEREGLGDLFAVQPTKWTVLAVLALRPAGPAELSRDLDVPADVVNEYMDELVAEGHITEADPDPSGTTSETRYRTLLGVIELEEWASMEPAERTRISTEVLRLIEGDIDRALEEHTFDRRADRHLTRISVTVDEEGWRELADLHRAMVIASHNVRLRSARRLKKSGRKGVAGSTVQMLFETPED
jgi:AcrR family transcriptional regulator